MKRWLYIMFFLSGFVSLIYQVLWLRELRLLFGSTAVAVTTTLIVFFLGLAIGGKWFGKISKKTKNHLNLYGKIEIGIAIFALLYFFILEFYFGIYGNLVGISENAGFLLLIKFLLAVVLLLPAAILIGGTLPVLGDFLVDSKKNFPEEISYIYGINTLGAALGAMTAGFFLPAIIGFDKSYYFAMSLNIAIGLLAFYLSGRVKKESESYFDVESYSLENIAKRKIWVLIFFSGFLTLGLEILWTIMFAQVAINDVYSFSLILVMFLLSLGFGAIFANYLIKKEWDTWNTLFILFISSGILIGISMYLFHTFTNGLNQIIAVNGFYGYLIDLFKIGIPVVLIPGVVFGAIFPFLLKIVRGMKNNSGESIGTWIFINTVGGIVGSFFVGFYFIKIFGLWGSIGAIAGIYFVLGFYVSYGNTKMLPKFVVVVILIFIFSIYLPSTFDSVLLNEIDEDKLVGAFNGRDGLIAVIESHPQDYPSGYNDLYITLNNHYTIGGRGALPSERRQAHLPLWIHENPKSVFVLGMGTGITAGAALYHDVDSLVVTELVPEIALAAEEHFELYVNGLFGDNRAEIVTEDGRIYLQSTDKKFDVIIGDLFLPWEVGAGSLYTKEHFEIVKNSLNDNGLFAQWIPLYQLSEEEFGVITRTFIDVFPDTTLWRGNFNSDKPIVALIGYRTRGMLNGKNYISNVREMEKLEDREVLIDALASVKSLQVLAVNPDSRGFLENVFPTMIETIPFTFYLGNLGENKDLFLEYEINTDDKPKIEFLAPKSLIKAQSGKSDFIVGGKAGELFGKIRKENSISSDPYLIELSEEQRRFVVAGDIYFNSVVYEYRYRETGNFEDFEMAKKLFDEYLEKTGLGEND